jgi:hypothetical protein
MADGADSIFPHAAQQQDPGLRSAREKVSLIGQFKFSMPRFKDTAVPSV